MAALSSNRIAWTYATHGGDVFRVSAEKALTDQAKQGGGAAAITVPGKPSGLRMRKVAVRSASGASRYVVSYAEGSPIETAGETINLNLDNVSTAFTSRGVIVNERLGRQTLQST